MNYEIGTNNFDEVSNISLSGFSSEEILRLLNECVGSNEIVLFHYLLQSPEGKLIPPESLVEPFFMACTGGERAHVTALLDFGIDPNIQSNTAETALSSAAAWGNDAIIIELTRQGARLQSNSVERNEELTLMLKNCSEFTLSEIFHDNSSISLCEVISFARDLGRLDIVKFLSEGEP